MTPPHLLLQAELDPSTGGTFDAHADPAAPCVGCGRYTCRCDEQIDD